MKQLTQQLKTGKMEILEGAMPALTKGYIRVRNHYSVISAGTESKTVKDARKGYIAKALARQKEVKLVLELAKSQGILQTYHNVMNKLEAPSTLGYSSAGEVIAVGENVRGFKVGDLVACGGSNADHAEVVSVSEKLCVKVPPEIDLRHAAFTTVASVALQGIRQADLKLGENCAVIGLGLIGQLTIMLLNASGISVIGLDIDPFQIENAKKMNPFAIMNIRNENLYKEVMEITKGYGVDAVIITASTTSTEPINVAGGICRKKGKVIVVGAVPTGFERVEYYKKELELRMSSSYGPGRYDSIYEEKGIDYPIGYVRWTENRNMEAFIDLLKTSRINPEPLITHEIDFGEAAKAYDIIVNKKEYYAGILLKYDTVKKHNHLNVIAGRQIKKMDSRPNIGFIGAGNFAQNYLLPNLKDSANMICVSTAHGNTSNYIAEKFGFSIASTNAQDVLNSDVIDTVFIATRHNLHAEYVTNALNKGKNVFCEKPLCMNETELNEIKEVYEKQNNNLMVGYNRRFAPAINKLSEEINHRIPVSINYRINSGTLPKDHWSHDPDVGGGRIIGEMCHFIDLCNFIASSRVKYLSASVMESAENMMDTVSVNLSYENGSLASLSYFSNGSKMLAKEYFEVFNAGSVFVVDDFKKVIRYGKSRKLIYSGKSDKGHSREISEFLDSLSMGKCIIPFSEIYHSSLITFKIIESIINRRTIEISG